MAYLGAHRTVAGFAALVRRQHGVVSHRQLIELGVHPQAIKRRVAAGRLHRVHLRVFAVGRPELDQLGTWMAAVLACGPDAALSHGSAAVLWGIRPAASAEPIVISVPAVRSRRPRGVEVHRRRDLETRDIRRRNRIPLTSPVLTLIDLASTLAPADLERAVNEADKRHLIRSDRLRAALDEGPRRPGIGVLRALLDRRTFRLTDSELERRFLPLARSAGLPAPETQTRVNGFRVDFWWPDLGLVVETDGLRYHRTPIQQARDLKRDQRHTAAGLTVLRFTHDQVAHERSDIRLKLRSVARNLEP